jgi:hypothetical protein
LKSGETKVQYTIPTRTATTPAYPAGTRAGRPKNRRKPCSPIRIAIANSTFATTIDSTGEICPCDAKQSSEITASAFATTQ